MKSTENKKLEEDADFFLDITGEVCPMTFVRTKLLIERMAPGQTAAIRLQGAEPLANVPRSIVESGHQVLSLHPEDPAAGPHSVHRLRLMRQ
jgi:TusA-related sulfurtransferase